MVGVGPARFVVAAGVAAGAVAGGAEPALRGGGLVRAGGLRPVEHRAAAVTVRVLAAAAAVAALGSPGRRSKEAGRSAATAATSSSS